jgi:hypothetical protein
VAAPSFVDTLLESRARAIYTLLEGQFANADAIRQQGQWILALEIARAVAESDVQQEAVVIPKNPSDGLLMSIAIRLDHALGMPGYYDRQPGVRYSHARALEMALSDARRAHEEITGEGFYTPNREEFYSGLAKGAQETE